MKTKNKILFTDVPKFNELKYFVGIIDFRENLSALSNFTWQKLKTRRLIETHRDILAAPVDRKFSHIHVIFPGNYTNGQIKHFINETNLTLSGQSSLPKETYLDCIFFTITIRISPEWSRIEKYFVKGNFLNVFRSAEAIKFQLLLTDGCLAFSAMALRLKLPSANLIDLEVDFKELFEKGFTAVQKKVFVLPYLKSGTAVCLYTKLPQSCPFGSYEEIKAHWKKLYGYTLPSSEESMTYVEVTFNHGFSYLYPIVCICPFKPIHFRSSNELRVIDDFSKVLKNKIPKICGHPIEINVKDDRVFRPVSKLHLASEVVDKANLSSLVSDDKVVLDFQNENAAKCDLTVPCKKRGRSPPLFLPCFGQVAPKPTDETFKCFPIFSPKVKAAHSGPENPSKNLKSSQTELFHRVKDSANGKTLHKMSLLTLLKFCKGNGIPVKKKEKKEATLEKIYSFFN